MLWIMSNTLTVRFNKIDFFFFLIAKQFILDSWKHESIVFMISIFWKNCRYAKIPGIQPQKSTVSINISTI